MAGTRDLVRLIERDPALAGRLLRAANSALYTRGDQVTSITAAVNRLGLSQVRSLCMVVAVVRAFGDGHPHLDHQRFWEHSAAVGILTEYLTRQSNRHAQVDESEAYVAGLLHDVGILILDQFFPEEFAAVARITEEEATGRWRVEDRLLTINHGTIGGLLLARWALPKRVSAAVTNHHHPDASPDEALPLAELVWAAEALCSATGLDLPQEGLAEVSTLQVFERLEIPADQHDRILAQVGAIGEQAKQFNS